MKKVKVCFIMTDAISFQMLCRAQFEYMQNNSNFEMTFISGGKQADFDKLARRKVGRIFDAKLFRKPSLVNDIKSLVLLISYFSTHKFDLVIYSTPKALLLGSLSAFITKQDRTIAVVQGRAYENFTGKKRIFYEFLDKFSFLLSHRVLFVSESLASAYLKEKIVNPKKSHVVSYGSYNGVDINRFNLKEKIGITEDRQKPFTVIIAGRICPDKGLYDLGEIIKHINVSNISFKLVGPIEDVESDVFLKKLMSKYSNVEYIPYTDNIEIFFKIADLHLFLTHREGFGNVAIEAAACGIPTFAYDVIGVKNSVEEGVSGKKFSFQDFKTIANAIEQAANDPDFNSKYPNARAWAIENFEQKKVWKNYLNFYNSVMNTNS